MNSKSAADVTQATIALLKPFEDVVHTITADNGKEFAYHEKISEALSADVYFAHLYRSWERSLSENTNGLLRQYFLMHTDFKKVGLKEVRQALHSAKLSPKKRPGLQNSSPVNGNYRAALAA